MQEELKETMMQKKKRNKSQEPAGTVDNEAQAWLSDDGFNSQGSLEVLADDEDDKQRLKEIMGEENFLGITNEKELKQVSSKDKTSGLLYGGDSKKLIVA